MISRHERYSPDHATHELLDLLTRLWTYKIIVTLQSAGPCRFSLLHQRINGISQRLLVERLQQLEDHALIVRIVESTNPRVATYSLTNRAAELQSGFACLREVINKWEREDSTPEGYGRARLQLHDNTA